ncbi:hypothetical protein HPB50_018895 [Hyalomma asiaticum]|uniref:Uncharacterized protein n=1 Tax=Hyalomma asiaticum TaxID=266040 RepID=A0ACB7TKD3_HYAAI|nr:hypothetical protein HPB50_018895 [Hyalomma asiaticum]
MDPIYHKGSRKDRDAALLKAYCNDKNAQFTDVSRYPARGRFATVVINPEKTTHVSSVQKTKKTPGVAVEMAIALSITDADTQLKLSGSHTAVRYFAKGRISTEDFRMLGNASEVSQASCISFLSRMDAMFPPLPNLSKGAHSAARDAITRAGGVGRLEQYAN